MQQQHGRNICLSNNSDLDFLNDSVNINSISSTGLVLSIQQNN
jgi:hypothetical protein